MAKKRTSDSSKQKDYMLIGIDGGGTRTRGILQQNDKILASTISGTTRVGAVGVGESCERLLYVIQDLCDQAEIDTMDIDAVVVGLAGIWLEEEKKRSLHLLKTLARTDRLILNDLIVTSDAELAVHGAFDGGQGIVIIVGTGSIAIGKTKGGKFVRSGGWGIELDDEGSGAWIGREGITAVFRALDGRGKMTKLCKVIEEMIPTIDLKEPRTIVKAYAERTFEYQMLTPQVMQLAEKGDEVCLDIITRACSHIMELIDAIGKQYKTKTIPITLMGGVVEHNTLLTKLIEKELKKRKKFKNIKPIGSALNGAISMGYELLNTME